MTVQLHPLRDRILIRVRPLPNQIGSIILPSRKDYAVPADVLAIGPEVRDVQVGWVVLVPVVAGQQVGEDVLIAESAVLGRET